MAYTCENGLNKRVNVVKVLLQPPETAKFAKSDHLRERLPTRIAGRCASAEVAQATTCLYPARFSTPGFTLKLYGFQCKSRQRKCCAFGVRKAAQKSPVSAFNFNVGLCLHR